MNVYVESNFVLELAFMQEQQESCESILRLCEAGRLRVIMPAYSIVEPHETMVRRERDRKALQERFLREIGQLLRSDPYKGENDVLQQVAIFLTHSIDEEIRRLDLTLARLLRITDVISLDAEILTKAQDIQRMLELAPQDAVVYASVVQHLAASASTANCF